MTIHSAFLILLLALNGVVFFVFEASSQEASGDRIFELIQGSEEEIRPPGIYVLPDALPEPDKVVEEKTEKSALESVEDFIKSFNDAEIEPLENAPKERVLLDQKPFSVQVRLINKRLGRVKDVSLQNESPVQQGNLIFLARQCVKDYKGEEGNNVAYVNLLDLSTGQSLFSGWLYQRTPSSTGLSHPVYELRLLGCRYLS